MTVSSLERQIQIQDLMQVPVYANAKTLKSTLGYEPIVYPIGEASPEGENSNKVTMTIDFEVSSREPDSMSGLMFMTHANFSVAYELPASERKRNAALYIKQAIASLQDYYTLNFCNDVEQLYFDDISWTTSMDTTSTTEYILSIDLRFRDYPDQEAV